MENLLRKKLEAYINMSLLSATMSHLDRSDIPSCPIDRRTLLVVKDRQDKNYYVYPVGELCLMGNLSAHNAKVVGYVPQKRFPKEPLHFVYSFWELQTLYGVFVRRDYYTNP